MSEHPFLILCGGDTAEADDWESAKVAAVTLVKDRLENVGPRRAVVTEVEIHCPSLGWSGV